MRMRRCSIRQIAGELGRSPSTICREICRNRRADGGYRAFTAGEHARGRRSRSRRNAHFGTDDWVTVESLLQLTEEEARLQDTGGVLCTGRVDASVRCASVALQT
jgi:IS30 family transposase